MTGKPVDMGKGDRWALYKTRYGYGVVGFKIFSMSFPTLPVLYSTVQPSFPSLLSFSMPLPFEWGIQLNFIRKLSTRHRTWAERKAVRLAPHLILIGL